MSRKIPRQEWRGSRRIGQIGSIRRRKGQLFALVRGWGRWFSVDEVLIVANVPRREWFTPAV